MHISGGKTTINDNHGDISLSMNTQVMNNIIISFHNSVISQKNHRINIPDHLGRMLILELTFFGNDFSIRGIYQNPTKICMDFVIKTATKGQWEQIKKLLGL